MRLLCCRIVKMVVLTTLVFADSAFGQRDAIDDLLSRVEINKSINVSRTTSCVPEILEGKGTAAAGQTAQFIYNAMYIWEEVLHDGAACVLILKPSLRALTEQEARLFLQASQSSFPEPPEGSSKSMVAPTILTGPHPVDVEDSQHEVKIESDIPVSKASSSQPRDDRAIHYDNSFPFNTVALIQTGAPSSNSVGGSSGVQISPYIYLTAAHVLTERGSGYMKPHVRVYPAHKLPSATSAIAPVAAIPNPGYIAAATSAAGAHFDIGFVKTVTPRFLDKYPAIWMPYRQDIYPPVYGDSFSDVWSIPRQVSLDYACMKSWRLQSPYYTTPDCYGRQITVYNRIQAVGYPNYVRDVDNRSTLLPYSQVTRLSGWPIGFGFFNNPPALPALAFSGYVSSGDSGGPVFGIIMKSSTQPENYVPLVRILGITGGRVTGFLQDHQNIAVGAFRVDEFWSDHLSWEPAFSVSVDVPAEGFIRSGSTIDVKVEAPGVSQVEVYERHDQYGEQTFIGFASGSTRIPRPVSAFYNEPRNYTYEIRAHPENSIVLGAFSVRVCEVIVLPWSRSDLRRPGCR